MKTLRTLWMVVMAVGFSFAIAGLASATNITCGDCHSTPPVDGDNCASDARGLHGTHFNYSSTDMPKSASTTDKCAYCHTATTATAPGVTHNNNYVNVTSTAAAPGLSYDGANCTDACHNNVATAPWGNYTSPTVLLACDACHDDSGAIASAGHAVHLATAITVSGLGNGTNVDCNACHDDNSGDGGNGQDGAVKAYPHASDGTNVVADSAALKSGVGATRAAGTADTCATACHDNAADDVQWGASALSCSSCHYCDTTTPTAAANDAATRTLTQHHSAHFTAGKDCSDCHAVPSAGDTSHATAIPQVRDNAAVVLATGTWDDGANTCANTGTGCHLTGTVDWDSAGLSCADCHNYPVGGNDWATANSGHLVRHDSPVVNTHMKATGYDAVNDVYATMVADADRCGKCHAGGTHNDLTVDVAGLGNNNCGVGNFTITVTETAVTATCSNVSCHSGKVTPNWF